MHWDLLCKERLTAKRRIEDRLKHSLAPMLPSSNAKHRHLSSSFVPAGPTPGRSPRKIDEVPRGLNTDEKSLLSVGESDLHAQIRDSTKRNFTPPSSQPLVMKRSGILIEENEEEADRCISTTRAAVIIPIRQHQSSTVVHHDKATISTNNNQHQNHPIIPSSSSLVLGGILTASSAVSRSKSSAFLHNDHDQQQQHEQDETKIGNIIGGTRQQFSSKSHQKKVKRGIRGWIGLNNSGAPPRRRLCFFLPVAVSLPCLIAVVVVSLLLLQIGAAVGLLSFSQKPRVLVEYKNRAVGGVHVGEGIEVESPPAVVVVRQSTATNKEEEDYQHSEQRIRHQQQQAVFIPTAIQLHRQHSDHEEGTVEGRNAHGKRDSSDTKYNLDMSNRGEGGGAFLTLKDMLNSAFLESNENEKKEKAEGEATFTDAKKEMTFVPSRRHPHHQVHSSSSRYLHDEYEHARQGTRIRTAIAEELESDDYRHQRQERRREHSWGTAASTTAEGMEKRASNFALNLADTTENLMLAELGDIFATKASATNKKRAHQSKEKEKEKDEDTKDCQGPRRMSIYPLGVIGDAGLKKQLNVVAGDHGVNNSTAENEEPIWGLEISGGVSALSQSFNSLRTLLSLLWKKGFNSAKDSGIISNSSSSLFSQFEEAVRMGVPLYVPTPHVSFSTREMQGNRDHRSKRQKPHMNGNKKVTNTNVKEKSEEEQKGNSDDHNINYDYSPMMQSTLQPLTVPLTRDVLRRIFKTADAHRLREKWSHPQQWTGQTYGQGYGHPNPSENRRSADSIQNSVPRRHPHDGEDNYFHQPGIVHIIGQASSFEFAEETILAPALANKFISEAELSSGTESEKNKKGLDRKGPSSASSPSFSLQSDKLLRTAGPAARSWAEFRSFLQTIDNIEMVRVRYFTHYYPTVHKSTYDSTSHSDNHDMDENGTTKKRQKEGSTIGKKREKATSSVVERIAFLSRGGARGRGARRKGRLHQQAGEKVGDGVGRGEGGDVLFFLSCYVDANIKRGEQESVQQRSEPKETNGEEDMLPLRKARLSDTLHNVQMMASGLETSDVPHHVSHRLTRVHPSTAPHLDRHWWELLPTMLPDVHNTMLAVSSALYQKLTHHEQQVGKDENTSDHRQEEEEEEKMASSAAFFLGVIAKHRLVSLGPDGVPLGSAFGNSMHSAAMAAITDGYGLEGEGAQSTGNSATRRGEPTSQESALSQAVLEAFTARANRNSGRRRGGGSVGQSPSSPFYSRESLLGLMAHQRTFLGCRVATEEDEEGELLFGAATSSSFSSLHKSPSALTVGGSGGKSENSLSSKSLMAVVALAKAGHYKRRLRLVSDGINAARASGAEPVLYHRLGGFSAQDGRSLEVTAAVEEEEPFRDGNNGASVIRRVALPSPYCFSGAFLAIADAIATTPEVLPTTIFMRPRSSRSPSLGSLNSSRQGKRKVDRQNNLSKIAADNNVATVRRRSSWSSWLARLAHTTMFKFRHHANGRDDPFVKLPRGTRRLWHQRGEGIDDRYDYMYYYYSRLPTVLLRPPPSAKSANDLAFLRPSRDEVDSVDNDENGKDAKRIIGDSVEHNEPFIGFFDKQSKDARGSSPHIIDSDEFEGDDSDGTDGDDWWEKHSDNDYESIFEADEERRVAVGRGGGAELLPSSGESTARGYDTAAALKRLRSSLPWTSSVPLGLFPSAQHRFFFQMIHKLLYWRSNNHELFGGLAVSVPLAKYTIADDRAYVREEEGSSRIDDRLASAGRGPNRRGSPSASNTRDATNKVNGYAHDVSTVFSALSSLASSFPLRFYSTPTATVVIRGVVDDGGGDGATTSGKGASSTKSLGPSAFGSVEGGSFFDALSPNQMVPHVDEHYAIKTERGGGPPSRSQAPPTMMMPPSLASYLYWSALCHEDVRGCSWRHAHWHTPLTVVQRGTPSGGADRELESVGEVRAEERKEIGGKGDGKGENNINPNPAALMLSQERVRFSRAHFLSDVVGRVGPRPFFQLFREYGHFPLLHVLSRPQLPPSASLGFLSGVSVSWETFCIKCFGFSTELMHFLKPLEHQIDISTPHDPSACFCDGQPYSFDASLVRVASPRRRPSAFSTVVASSSGAARHQADFERKAFLFSSSTNRVDSDDRDYIAKPWEEDYVGTEEKLLSSGNDLIAKGNADGNVHHQQQILTEVGEERRAFNSARRNNNDKKSKKNKNTLAQTSHSGEGGGKGGFSPFSLKKKEGDFSNQYSKEGGQRFFSSFSVSGGEDPPHHIKVMIVHKDPGSWPRRGGSGSEGKHTDHIIIGRAMFEATTLPRDWVHNKGEVDEVWVPTRFSRYIFEKEGFDPLKLVVMPEPIDVHYFNPSTVAPLLLPQALHAGHWRHVGNRIGADRLLAYGETNEFAIGLSAEHDTSDNSKNGEVVNALISPPLSILRKDLAILAEQSLELQSHRTHLQPSKSGNNSSINTLAAAASEMIQKLSSITRSLSSNYKFLGVFKWEERKAWKALLTAYCRAFSPSDPVSLYLVTYRYGDGGRNPESIVNDIRTFVRGVARRGEKDREDGGKTGKLRGLFRNIFEHDEQLGGSSLLEGDDALYNEEEEEDDNKESNSHPNPYHWPDRVPHIEIVTEQISDEEMVKVYRSVDAFVMPTRGEGWGLPIIQAMSMGLPTITTKFSGMVDFIDSFEEEDSHNRQHKEHEQEAGESRSPSSRDAHSASAPFTLPPPAGSTAFLVPFKLTDVRPGSGVGEGNTLDQGPMQWAEPDPTALESTLRFVFENPEIAESVGRRARKHIVAHYSEEAIVELVKARLRYLKETQAVRRRERG